MSAHRVYHSMNRLSLKIGIVPALVFASLLPASARGLEAQSFDDGPQEVDRIVAIAQDSIIVMSQLRERVLQMELQGFPMPSDSAALEEVQRELLEQMVNEQLVIQAALADTTILVNEEQLDEIVRQDVDQRVQQAGGQAAFQALLDEQGLTMVAFREQRKDDIRAQQLSQQYMQKQQRNVRVAEIEESEMREFYEENRAQIGRRPATITFRQVILEPRPTLEADSAALRKADSLYFEILNGGDFEELAQRWSDDPGSKQLGGDLGWFRRGAGFVRDFEDAAFSLRSGDVSTPVRTQFGYHLIKVDRIRGPERKARHLLIGFNLGPEDDTRAQLLADSILARAQAGERVRDLADEYGSPELPDSLTTTQDQLSSLPLGFAAALGQADPGDLLGPLTVPTGQTNSYAVVEVVDVRQEGDYTYEDLEGQIRQRLTQQKVLEELMRSLREQAYVEIKM